MNRELGSTTAYRDGVQLSPAHTSGENNSSLSIDFVLHEGASFSLLSGSKQERSA